MKVKKTKIDTLNKCYSIGALTYNGKPHFIVAAEKSDPCYLYDMSGKRVDTIWTEPGGTMTIVQVPGCDGEFLATHKFYSPNDGAAAKIVHVKKEGDAWKVRTLCDLPFVHRFDIVQRNGVNHLIACALKSGHEFKDDWSHPGIVFVSVLPNDIAKAIDSADGKPAVDLKVIREGMTKNHGYTRDYVDDVQTGIVSAECGVLRFTPPESKDGEWKIEQLLDTPASDAILIDLNGDGKKEMLVLSPFHGEKLAIYELDGSSYKKAYEHPAPLEFLHAICAGKICGKNTIIIGHRKGERDLLAFTYEDGAYKATVIDKDCGPANSAIFERDGKEIVVSANRETDEVAIYEFE